MKMQWLEGDSKCQIEEGTSYNNKMLSRIFEITRKTFLIGPIYRKTPITSFLTKNRDIFWYNLFIVSKNAQNCWGLNLFSSGFDSREMRNRLQKFQYF